MRQFIVWTKVHTDISTRTSYHISKPSFSTFDLLIMLFIYHVSNLWYLFTYTQALIYGFSVSLDIIIITLYICYVQQISSYISNWLKHPIRIIRKIQTLAEIFFSNKIVYSDLIIGCLASNIKLIIDLIMDLQFQQRTVFKLINNRRTVYRLEENSYRNILTWT